MNDRGVLTSERLDETWLTLFDIAKEDSRNISIEERVILREARHLVNKYQLRVGKKEKTADAGTPTAKDEAKQMHKEDMVMEAADMAQTLKEHGRQSDE